MIADLLQKSEWLSSFRVDQHSPPPLERCAPRSDSPPLVQIRQTLREVFQAGEVVDRQEVVLAALDRLEQLADVVVIEGVGGFRVPLSGELDSADLAKAIAAPILMVVPMRLGCINHALLTAEAVAGRGLKLLGWTANAGIDPDYSRIAPTVDTITSRIHAPCVGVLPRLADLDFGQGGANHLNIDLILNRLRSPVATGHT